MLCGSPILRFKIPAVILQRVYQKHSDSVPAKQMLRHAADVSDRTIDFIFGKRIFTDQKSSVISQHFPAPPGFKDLFCIHHFPHFLRNSIDAYICQNLLRFLKLRICLIVFYLLISGYFRDEGLGFKIGKINIPVVRYDGSLTGPPTGRVK